MNVLYWIVVGLIAGWLAGQVMRGGGYGVVVDIVLGILGGIVGGWVFGALGIGAGGLIGSIVVAFVGAVILVGGTLDDGAENAPLARLLANHFTVYNYARRGRGASGNTPPYALAR